MPDRKKEIIDFRLAGSEGATAWEGFLTDLYRRGLTGKGLDMICVDGGSGLLAALPKNTSTKRLRMVSPLTTWFWGAYLVSSMTPGMSAIEFQRQLGLTRYETAFQLLHKLRAGMVRQDRDRIGGNLARGDHVEIDETYIGGVTRGEGKGVHADEKTLVVAAVEVRTRPAKKGDKPMRRGGRYAGRLRLEIAPNRGAKALTGFVEAAVEPGAMVITDAWNGYNTLGARGYAYLPVVESGRPEVAEEFLPIVHLVFSNRKAWLAGTHHGAISQSTCKPT